MRARLMVAVWLCGWCLNGAWAADALPSGLVQVDAYPAPALIVQQESGAKLNLKTAQGRWAFVHFWATWCVPCKREMPHIAKLQKQMQGKSLTFFVVNTADSEDAIFEFLGSVSAEMSSLRDPDGQYTELWKPRGLPATFLVDPQGVVRYRALGGRDWGSKPYVDFLEHLIGAAH